MNKYRYQVYNYDKPAVWYTVDCKVVGQTDKSYKIKLLAHGVRGRKFGDEIWVQKKFVSVPDIPPRVDCSGAWWHD
jgi:hypothetical protein